MARPPPGRAWTRWRVPTPACAPPASCPTSSLSRAAPARSPPGLTQSKPFSPGPPVAEELRAPAPTQGRARLRRQAAPGADSPRLSRPRCPRPWRAAAAGGVRGVVNEAKPEEDAAPRREEGAPGLRLPGRGGPRGQQQ